jgi:cobalt-zinc-cadmium efflux system membrane fusion protein
VQAGRSEAAVAVAADAVQTVDGQPAVFVRSARGFRCSRWCWAAATAADRDPARPAAGAQYAAANSLC